MFNLYTFLLRYPNAKLICLTVKTEADIVKRIIDSVLQNDAIDDSVIVKIEDGYVTHLVVVGYTPDIKSILTETMDALKFNRYEFHNMSCEFKRLLTILIGDSTPTIHAKDEE